MILKGRQKIIGDYTTEDTKDISKLCDILNKGFVIHKQNKVEIDYLIGYRSGVQPILRKTKEVRPEINNKVVINHAQMTTRTVNGYFLGNPIQYIQNGSTNKKALIDELNRYVQYEDKASVDKEIGDYQSVTGVGYRIIYRDGELKDEVPFEDKSLDPSTTFVVYENSIAERQLVGVTYYNLYNDNLYTGQRVYVYTNHGLYEFETKQNAECKPEDLVNFQPYDVGGIPIVEYPNNMWRVGDWELVIGLMDAINALQSGRLDDIDQTVQALLVFMNAEINEEVYKEMRDAGVVMLNNKTGDKASVDVIKNQLEQNGLNMYSQELEELLYAMVGVPDRNNRSGGGGDTGQAVELRDGWADLEIVARNKELTFKKSEKRALRIILNMFNVGRTEKLSMLDLDIKFSRNKNNNLLVKAQAYQSLLATKTLSPEDCLSIVDLVSDVNEFISRGKEFWGENFAGQIPVIEEVNTGIEPPCR